MSKRMRTRKDLLSSRRRRPTYVRVRINPISSRNITSMHVKKSMNPISIELLGELWYQERGSTLWIQTSVKPNPLLQSS